MPSTLPSRSSNLCSPSSHSPLSQVLEKYKVSPDSSSSTPSRATTAHSHAHLSSASRLSRPTVSSEAKLSPSKLCPSKGSSGASERLNLSPCQSASSLRSSLAPTTRALWASDSSARLTTSLCQTRISEVSSDRRRNLHINWKPQESAVNRRGRRCDLLVSEKENYMRDLEQTRARSELGRPPKETKGTSRNQRTFLEPPKTAFGEAAERIR